LEGTLGGNYSDPNDLALAIIISLPLCLALLFLSRSWLHKAAWALAMLVMLYTVFLTGSRGGFISLIVTAAMSLWEFAIRGRRRYLFVLAALVAVVLWLSSSGVLSGRLKGTFNPNENTAASYGSAEGRRELFWRSVEVTKNHPLFGVGPGNFEEVSGSWHVTHNSFTQMSSEGGVPAFVFYVLILWSGFKNVRAVKRYAKGERETSLLAKALHASLVGYVAGSCFLSVNYEFFPYFFVAYTTALFLARKSAAQSREHESVSRERSGQESLAPLQGAMDSAASAP
jgi:O-antigen ligase